MLRWAPESQPREFVESPGPEHKGNVNAESTGKDKGAFCSAVRTGFSAVAQPCRKDQEWELQPEWEAWTLQISQSSLHLTIPMTTDKRP